MPRGTEALMAKRKDPCERKGAMQCNERFCVERFCVHRYEKHENDPEGPYICGGDKNDRKDCPRALARRVNWLDDALKWIAQQPCRAEAEGADGKHITCRETGACATEWCLPCYAAAALSAWRGT